MKKLTNRRNIIQKLGSLAASSSLIGSVGGSPTENGLTIRRKNHNPITGSELRQKRKELLTNLGVYSNTTYGRNDTIVISTINEGDEFIAYNFYLDDQGAPREYFGRRVNVDSNIGFRIQTSGNRDTNRVHKSANEHLATDKMGKSVLSYQGEGGEHNWRDWTLVNQTSGINTLKPWGSVEYDIEHRANPNGGGYHATRTFVEMQAGHTRPDWPCPCGIDGDENRPFRFNHRSRVETNWERGSPVDAVTVDRDPRGNRNGETVGESVNLGGGVGALNGGVGYSYSQKARKVVDISQDDQLQNTIHKLKCTAKRLNQGSAAKGNAYFRPGSLARIDAADSTCEDIATIKIKAQWKAPDLWTPAFESTTFEHTFRKPGVGCR